VGGDGLTGNDQILNSWKEIARYLGRGVRTVQRWERDMGLPVRRPRGRDRSAVVALRSDIDAWVNRCPVKDVRSATTIHDVKVRAGSMQAMAARLLKLAAQTQAETQRALDLYNKRLQGRARQTSNTA
jgi:predicted DNA-binding transcriptional regulator AlpA